MTEQFVQRCTLRLVIITRDFIVLLPNFDRDARFLKNLPDAPRHRYVSGAVLGATPDKHAPAYLFASRVASEVIALLLAGPV